MTDRTDSPSGSASSGEIESPPQSLGGILRHLGPGLIIAGSIVGSGELIATTDTGAKAGFWLLWLIIIGCVIKVFVQVEFGRHAIVTGKTTLRALNGVPGPRLGRANWLLLYWFIMYLVILGQQGGIVGGVGQAMALSWPVTSDGKRYNEIVDAETQLKVEERYLQLFQERSAGVENYEQELDTLQKKIAATRTRVEQLGEKPAALYDDRIWATIIAVGTSVLLIFGRYGLIQALATVFVALFTVITIVNLCLLQSDTTLAVTGGEVIDGLRFQLTPKEEAVARGVGMSPLVTALAAFGIIGVGASELIAYPYWCVEKGYARFTGTREETSAWAERARGWLRVMRWDVWCSMLVYTFATVAFYLLGAATLGRFHLDPEGTEMVRTLSVMFEPVFGVWANVLFLFGAVAVLYSTFFLGAAAAGLMLTDCMRVFGVRMDRPGSRRRWIQTIRATFPLVCLTVYLFVQAPKQLVLAGGVMQALMLPMLAVAALYFRYRQSDERLRPSRLWDILLWLSGFAMLIAGGTLFYLKVVG